jgi:HAD superfamily hydrolase (TIGR01549 family)
LTSGHTGSVPVDSEPLTSAPVALFDLDNTLYDRAGTFRRWASAFVAGRPDPAGEVEWLCEVDRDGMTERVEFWTQIRRRYRLDTPLDEMDSRYRKGYLDTIEPDVRVTRALGVLRDAGWRIGVVTNGPTPHQAQKAERLGLLPLTDCFCASGEIGFAKPDPRIFHEAIRRCGGPGPETWMVGDSPLSDIGGAQSLGFRTVWMHRGRDWDPEHGPNPDHAAESIPEAVDFLMA